jgi:hypothetical protein
MKAFRILALGLTALVFAAVVLAQVPAPQKTRPSRSIGSARASVRSLSEIRASALQSHVDGAAQGTGPRVAIPLPYSTGFEAPDFAVGTLEPQAFWSASFINNSWAQISNSHPAGGVGQHMRLGHNTEIVPPAQGTYLAKYGDMINLPTPTPTGLHSVSANISVNQLSGNGNSYSLTAGNIFPNGITMYEARLFMYDYDLDYDYDYNDIAVLDDATCSGAAAFVVVPDAQWGDIGEYHNYRMEMDPDAPCGVSGQPGDIGVTASQVKYYRDNVLIYSGNYPFGATATPIKFANTVGGTRFVSSSTGFTETGDFDNVSLTQIAGACCSESGCTLVATPAECTGTYQGDGSRCSPDPCPVPGMGSCCSFTGICSLTTSAGCIGTFYGEGTTCVSNPCPTGACCQSSGTCTITTQAACNGIYQGDNTNCGTSPCPQPTGACCDGSGACTITTQTGCTGIYQGNGSTCNPNPCPQPTGACCDGTNCTLTTEGQCTATYYGDGTNCGTPPGPGNALLFDGTNDRVAIPGSTSYAFGTGPFTIEMWIRPDVLSGDNRVLFCNQVLDNWQGYLDQGGTSAGMHFVASAQFANSSGLVWTLGQWYHLSWVRSGNTVTLYRNGNSVGSGTVTASSGNTTILQFGLRDSSTHPWNGVLDEVRIWNLARTQAQIQSTMSQTIPTSSTGLIGYWNFDEASGQTVVDISPSANNGSLGANGNVGSDDPTRVTSTAPITGGSGANPCSATATGACCAGGGCSVTTQSACTGTYQGNGVPCTPDPCAPPPTGGCCATDGTCSLTTQAACTGVYHGNGTSCTPSPCPLPSGACCTVASGCSITVQAACTGTYHANVTTCGGDCNNNSIPDGCELDTDGDGKIDTCDNCPSVPNLNQIDTDGDGVGDACDTCTDTDGDGFGNPGFPLNTCPADNCPAASNPSQLNSDGDSLGDACDNCPSVSNPDQQNSDGDALGNACDNCPTVTNSNQADCDNNGTGDACQAGVMDCNLNGTPDSCDIANCPQGVPACDDCNNNDRPDSCDIAGGQATDVNSDGIPDSCQLDIRVAPVVTLINPATTTEIRGALPNSTTSIVRGSTFYVELWTSDVGAINTGLTGVYVDLGFCPQITPQALFHGNTFTVFSSGTINGSTIDEMGGSTFSGGVGNEPNWARIGWVRVTASVETASCPVTVLQSSSGVAAFGRGDINWAFVNLGSVNIEIQPPTKTYDLTGNSVINVGDFSLFVPSWLQSVPPANTAHDFDCDNSVGVSDLSWFATGWLKNVTDPTILYPPCPPPGFTRSGDDSIPLDGVEMQTASIDVNLRLVALTSPSGSDTTTILPTSLTSVPVGQSYYLEFWASDIGDINTGFTSVYADVTVPISAASVTNIGFGSILNLFTTGTAGSGLINELGGSSLPGGAGIGPQWVRVATVTMSATSNAPNIPYAFLPSSTGVAAFGRGAIPWNDISLQGVTVRHGLGGDIDGDGDVDGIDLNTYVSVLLGADLNASHRAASDFNGDGQPSGKDTQGFVTCYLTAGCP